MIGPASTIRQNSGAYDDLGQSEYFHDMRSMPQHALAPDMPSCAWL